MQRVMQHINKYIEGAMENGNEVSQIGSERSGSAQWNSAEASTWWNDPFQHDINVGYMQGDKPDAQCC